MSIDLLICLSVNLKSLSYRKFQFEKMRKIIFILSLIFSTFADEDIEDLLERCYPTSLDDASCAVKIIHSPIMRYP